VWLHGTFRGEDGDGKLLTRLSMDSKGCAFDDIYIERLRGTIKYDGRGERSSLDGHTPSDVYFRRVTLRNAA
jgi:hypothetical protein